VVWTPFYYSIAQKQHFFCIGTKSSSWVYQEFIQLNWASSKSQVQICSLLEISKWSKNWGKRCKKCFQWDKNFGEIDSARSKLIVRILNFFEHLKRQRHWRTWSEINITRPQDFMQSYSAQTWIRVNNKFSFQKLWRGNVIGEQGGKTLSECIRCLTQLTQLDLNLKWEKFLLFHISEDVA